MEFFFLKKRLIHAVLAALLLTGCEREVELELPPGTPRLVVDGRIELGQPPVVLLSRSLSVLGSSSIADWASNYVSGATVTVNGIALTEVCTATIPDSLLPILSSQLGLSSDDLSDLNVCVYVGLNDSLRGRAGRRYRLLIQAEGHTLSASTSIPHPVQPDSLWFRTWANSNRFGYIFASIDDPDTLLNAYRVSTRRIGSLVQNGNPVDPVFYTPFGGTFIDEFFNGEIIEVIFTRGMPFNSSRQIDAGEEAGFFEIGDTVALRFCSIDQVSYDFYRTLEAQLGTVGSPFATPGNLRSNIEGGLGVWAGFACEIDTVLALP